MADTWTLLKVFLKNDYNFTLKGKKGRRNILLAIVLVVCLLPTIGLLYTSYVPLFDAHLDTIAWEGGLLLPAVICGITTLLALPTVMYFSADLDFLLTLPIRPQDIILAKVLLATLSAMTLYVPFCLPLLIAYVQSGPDLLSLLLALFVFLTFWIIPMALAALASVLLMKFVPALRSKDRFNLIFGLLMIVVCMIAGALGGLSSGSESSEMLAELLTDPATLSTINYACIQALWAARTIVSHTLSDLLLYVGATLLVCALFWLAARKWYLPAVTSMTQKTKKKRTAGKDKARTPFQAIAHAEIASLLRSPVNFMNCVIGDFLPLIFIPLFGLLLQEELPALRASLSPDMVLSWIFPIALYIGIFTGSMGCLGSATTFSRQGQNLYWMKVVPVSMTSQILALGCANFLFPLLSALAMAAGAAWLLGLGLLPFILMLAGLVIGIFLPNCFGLLLDGWRPKLVWTDETAAVKNNMNTIISMLGSMGLAILMAVPLLFMEPAMIQIYMYAMCALVFLCDILLVWQGPRYIAKWLQNKI